MTQSNHTAATVEETVDNRTVDIDMDILKKERTLDIGESPGTGAASRSLSEKWTGLNDSCNIKIEEDGADTENSGSVTSEPRRQFSRRNSNDSSCSRGSNGSSGSKSSTKRKSATKRRSWKKPKDKPKRPLSAYNIFFKHTRSRIVEGLSEEGTAEETIASIEGIVANSTETRRHRKTHGQISFGDLARTIADKWKSIDKNQKALFDHYAALDMKRYRRDVSIWKAKKEAEALAVAAGNDAGARPTSVSLEMSGHSHCSLTYMTDSQNTVGVGENYDDWNTPQHRAFSTSFNSVGEEEDFGIEPLPIADHMHESQNNNMIGQSIPSYIESSNNIGNNMMAADLNNGYNNNNGGNNSNGSMHNKKLHDIWMKNRQLEESINKLKKELSATNFNLGGSNNNNNTNGNQVNPESSQANSKFLNVPFPVGPSIDRMQQLHRRRMLMGDILPPMENGQNQQNPQGGLNQHGSSSNFEVVEEALDGMQMDPFDMNPVPFEEVFNATGAEANMKKKELISNLNHLDFFGNNNR